MNNAQERQPGKFIRSWYDHHVFGTPITARKRHRLGAYALPGEFKYIVDFWRAGRINAMCEPKKKLTLDDVLQRPCRHDKRYQAMLWRLGMPF